MLSSLKETAKKVTKNIEDFKFNLAIEELLNSFWHVFCDKYIEYSKQYLYNKKKDSKSIQFVLWKSLKTYLELLHPFIPFITEAVWQILPKGKDEPKTIMYASWPYKK